MIRKVSFRNFKAYRSLDLELEPFTVLVGPNASGKTTLLEGLRYISEIIDQLLGKRLRPTYETPGLRSYGTDAPLELSLSGLWGDANGVVKVKANPSPNENHGKRRSFDISGTWGGIDFPSASRTLEKVRERFRNPQAQSESLGPMAPYEEIRAALRSTVVLRLEASRLAEAAYGDEAVPEIQSDGSGLAAVLAYLKLSQDEVFEQVESDLRHIVPSVQRIRIERAAVERTTIRTLSLDDQEHEVPETRTLWGHRVVFDMNGAKGVPANAAGEGTLMALGFLVALTGMSRPSVMLLDDIEMALHPAAQGQLIGVLRRILGRNPGLQIVATSHSPFILNFLKPEEVRITSLAENGFARCVPMTSHPDFERWKGLMSPGEFWSTVGESWMHNSEAPAGQGEPATHE
jgi:energy-coupling factor transporter ATP-binding protein EcfA2